MAPPSALLRPPVGVKVFGTDLAEMEMSPVRSRPWFGACRARRAPTPSGVIGGYYLEIVPDRIALGRYGLSIADVQGNCRKRSSQLPSREEEPMLKLNPHHYRTLMCAESGIAD